jgi:DNA-binding transcriptional LysR family regulator
MNDMPTSAPFAWDLIRTFLAVAETGSFTAAAKALGSSQPTVGRQIAELEAQLGTPVFRRETRGHRLTEAGLRLIDHARAMNLAAARLSLEAAGQAETLKGTVRITASVVVSHYLLPGIFEAIRRAEPEIELELNPSDATENLLFREADIAVRMYRPAQLDIITRRVGTQRLGVFATRVYLDRAGTPTSPADIPDHTFIGYDRSDLMIRGMREMGIPADRSMFAIRCDNQTVYIEMVQAGCGLGIVPLNIAARDPNLVRLMPDLTLPDLPVWLAAPEALRTSPRIRRVWDLLAEGLGKLAGD